MIRSTQGWGTLGLSLFVIALLNFGCSRVWDASNRDAATADLKTILKIHTALDITPNCRMVGETRSFVCTFNATAGDVERLVSGLSLRPVNTESPQKDLLALLARPPEELQCSVGSDIRFYAVTGRPPQLRLSEGSAFEFLFLYYDVPAGRACVWSSYSYG